MANKKDLKFIITLLDDKTPDVRKSVIEALSSYGEELENDIYELKTEIPEGGVELLSPILKNYRKNYILKNWDAALSFPEEEKIEQSLKLLECYHHGLVNCKRFDILLADLETQFRKLYPDGDEIDLSNFLFKIKGISGAKEDYYNPLNSSIIYAILNNKGIPITLAVLYILLGKKLLFHIEGVNFPGHFLARTFIKDQAVLIDGFNGGKILQKSDIAQLADKETLESIYQTIDRKTSAITIIRRILNNLVNASKNRNDSPGSDFFQQLLKLT